jgi:hypothetical protein
VRLALQSYYPVSQDFLLRNLEVSSRLFGEVVSLNAEYAVDPRDGAAGLPRASSSPSFSAPSTSL